MLTRAVCALLATIVDEVDIARRAYCSLTILAQHMAAMEPRAPLLRGSSPPAPGANTDSSSIPHDSIPAEVAGLKQELENPRARADHAEVAYQVRPANTQPGAGSGSLFFIDSRGLRGHSGLGSGLPSACHPKPFTVMPETPLPPKAQDLVT